MLTCANTNVLCLFAFAFRLFLARFPFCQEEIPRFEGEIFGGDSLNIFSGGSAMNPALEVTCQSLCGGMGDLQSLGGPGTSIPKSGSGGSRTQHFEDDVFAYVGKDQE